MNPRKPSKVSVGALTMKAISATLLARGKGSLAAGAAQEVRHYHARKNSLPTRGLYSEKSEMAALLR